MDDKTSITPAWFSHRLSEVELVMNALRNRPCRQGGEYCRSNLDALTGMKRFFGFDGFRLYAGEPLQEHACRKRLERLHAVGYGIRKVQAGAVVAWLDKVSEREEAVLIPRLTLTREGPFRPARRTSGTLSGPPETTYS